MHKLFASVTRDLHSAKETSALCVFFRRLSRELLIPAQCQCCMNLTSKRSSCKSDFFSLQINWHKIHWTMTKYKRWILLLTGESTDELQRKKKIFSLKVESLGWRIFRSNQTEAIYNDSSWTKITSLRQHYVSFSHHIKRSAKREAKTKKKKYSKVV